MCKVWNVLPNPKGMFLAPPVKRSSRRAGEGSQPAFRGALQPGLARQKLCKCDEKSQTKMTPALCPNFQRRGSRCTCHMWITSNMRSVISCNISNFIGCMYDSQCDHYMVRLGSLRLDVRHNQPCACVLLREARRLQHGFEVRQLGFGLGQHLRAIRPLWNDFKTFRSGLRTSVIRFLRKECGCRELKIVKAKKRHVKECQRNQVIFRFRSLFFHYGLQPLPVRGPFAQSPAECFGTSSAPHLAFRTKRLNSKYMHWGAHWEDWDRDWKRRQKNAKDTMDMRKVASEEE